MMKIIFARAGEGKTRECIREIQNNANAKNIGVLCEDGDFAHKLETLGNKTILDGKDIFIYNSRATIDDILREESIFDMIILDTNKNLNHVLEKLDKCKNNNVIITQQAK